MHPIQSEAKQKKCKYTLCGIKCLNKYYTGTQNWKIIIPDKKNIST